MGPDGPERREGEPSGALARPDGEENHRKVVRAAFLKPINVAMLFIGGGFFVIAQSWWIIPLTLLTYVLLVVLAARDPIFTRKVLNQEDDPPSVTSGSDESGLTPERRARWLPRGQTRHKVEEALVNYRKLVASIEESGEVTRSVLDDTLPKLHAAADRLVDVAHEREKAHEAIQETASQTGEIRGQESASILRELEARVERADAEISDTHDRLLNLRARMIGASLNSEVENRAAASLLNRSLDELNFRLEALEDMSADPPDEGRR